MDSLSKLKEYESRMRTLDRELREKQLQSKLNEGTERAHKEWESAERLRREEDELRRLRNLQDEERRRREDAQTQRARIQYAQPFPAQYDYAAELAFRQREAEAQRLAALREQIRKQEEENRRLQERINAAYSAPTVQPNYPYPQPQSPYPQSDIPQPYYAPTQQPTQAAQPAQIYVTQNNAQQPYGAYPQSREVYPYTERTALQKNEEKEPAEKVVTVIRETEEAGESGVSFGERLTFAEAYIMLTKEQQRFCDGLRAYAREQSGAKEVPAKYHLCVGSGQKVIVKFEIKKGITIGMFRIVDERLKKLRRNATSNGAEIKIKETEVPIEDEFAFDSAKELIDLRITQLEEEQEYRKQQRRNKKKTGETNG